MPMQLPAMTDQQPYAKMLEGIKNPELADAFGDLLAYVDGDRIPTDPDVVDATCPPLSQLEGTLPPSRPVAPGEYARRFAHLLEPDASQAA